MWKELSKKTKMIIIGILSITILLVVGITYAYFTAATVGGNASANSIQLLTGTHGNITVNYLNGNGLINMNNVDLKENEKGTIKKEMVKFSVNYPGSEEENISINWKEVTNNFCQYQLGNICTNNDEDNYVGDEIYFDLYECNTQSDLQNATTTILNNCTNITNENNSAPLTGEEKQLQNVEVIPIINEVKYYIMILNINNLNVLQDYNQGKAFQGRIEVVLRNEFVLTLNLNGGVSEDLLTQNIRTGETIILTEPTKEDYTFIEWKVNVGGTDALLSGNTFTMGKENTTLKAIFAKTITEFSANNLITYEEFNPEADGYYKVELWGAKGGNSNYTGGAGAYVSGSIEMKEGETYYIYIGGLGNLTSTGGYNGGGRGQSKNPSGMSGGGGGATDIRYFGNITPSAEELLWNSSLGLNSRIMVAGGGGGGGNNGDGISGNGGAGGNTIGGSGTSSGSDCCGNSANASYNGKGGSQIAGGSGGMAAGSFGVGAIDSNVKGGSGGGGYYGGGSGYYGGGGGGGSSYISGSLGSIAITASDNRTAKCSAEVAASDLTCSFHYSEKAFYLTTMNQGTNSEAGKAKITYVGKQLNVPSYNISTTTTSSSPLIIDYMNTYQEINVLSSGYYKIELWGASGATYSTSWAPSGKGGYTQGTIYMEQGEKYYAFVGSEGLRRNTINGGYNGGGEALSNYAAGGGGATDIRYFSTTPSIEQLQWNSPLGLNNRIMVAGGGGAGGYNGDNKYGTGGAGGGLTGGTGTIGILNSTYWVVEADSSSNWTRGTGGTQNAGGTNYPVGGFGVPGTPGGTTYSGAGGGYYTGGGGYYGGGAGGGSSYISGHSGCTTHLNGKTFASTETTSGVKSGNGQAKITYIGNSL